jgi:hypothetical protein
MTDERETGPRPFSHLLAALADGDAHGELTGKLEELMRAMRAEAHARNGKVKGKLAFDLAFTCEPNDIVSIDYTIRMKAPDPKRPNTVLWATKQGGLSAQNPRQMNLGEIREVAPQAPHQVRSAPIGDGGVKEA